MEDPTNNNTLLELQIPDFEKAKHFYGTLGFNVIWERSPEKFKGYLVLKKDPRDSKRGYAVEIVLMVKNVEKYFEKVKGVVNIVEPLQKRPWGLVDFRIEDPFGFYLRFTEPHNILDSKYAVP